MNKPTGFLPSLHLLRGICAIAVAAYHFGAWTYGVQAYILSVGTFGVYTFFTLSAVVLLHRDAQYFTNGISAASLTGFYAKRFARIIPLLAAVAVVWMLYQHVRYGAELSSIWQRTFLTGSGMFALHMPGLLSTTNGAWSLGIEILFYAAFPVLALLAASASTRTIVTVVAGLVFTQQVLLATLPPSSDPEFWGQYTMPLTFAPFFAAGFLAYRLTGPTATWRLWAAIACLAAIFSFSLVFPDDIFKPGLAYISLSALSALAVWFAYRSQVPELLRAPSRFLGDISYALYLTHRMSYDLAVWLSPSDQLLPVVFILVCGFVAYACHRAIEIPATWVFRKMQPIT